MVFWQWAKLCWVNASQIRVGTLGCRLPIGARGLYDWQSVEESANARTDRLHITRDCQWRHET
ncbi:MAG: hypothetical protein ACJAR2_000254 [Ilumatobacter sp.]|jgi:hypothetical protein